ncbi:hypothetical protein [Geodermatophilus sp. CPCC 205761]
MLPARVKQTGVEGPPSDQEPSDDDRSTMPNDVADLIAAKGTA